MSDRFLSLSVGSVERSGAMIGDRDNKRATKMTMDELIKQAVARFDAMSEEEKATHRYEQQRSFVRGLCPGSADYKEWCAVVDQMLPPK